MKMDAKCRFCGIALSVEVDDDYAKLGDPHKFMQKASCDRCAKYQEQRRDLIENIKTICEVMIQRRPEAEAREMARDSLKGLCVRYLALLAKHRGHEVPDWDDSITDALMAKPREFYSVIRSMGEMTRQESLL